MTALIMKEGNACVCLAGMMIKPQIINLNDQERK